MPTLWLTLSIMFAGLMLLESLPAASQQYPTKPIRIVSSGLGGGNDVVARLIACRYFSRPRAP
jgi:tripartite-type tricarboxylate transporter receptor subunit TctC